MWTLAINNLRKCKIIPPPLALFVHSEEVDADYHVLCNYSVIEPSLDNII